ncbi:protein PYRICULARIA ORYZAE RESISTANCE 21 [Cocos nucifera]|uniref:Protein PYRICULARIA ORYZAE RESISTANCE 21 n=1 Tax=Cocos nucifera TaxID=13894 RepID=A0A8K0N154_COCNU|nr:protein PYRICULARIA ORYZAE RESISTANCE 21 [Cocos nucifera]
MISINKEREKITTISYDEKDGTVTISGPFDPQKLSNKLHCKARKVIKDIQIVMDPPKDQKGTPSKKDPKGKKEKKTQKEPAPEPCKVIKDIKIIVLDHPRDPKSPNQKTNPDPDPKPSPTPDPKPNPAPRDPPVLPVCCWMPYHVGYHGGSRCCSCGRVYGCVADGPPPVYGGTSHGGYQLFYEEYPSTSCTIM